MWRKTKIVEKPIELTVREKAELAAMITDYCIKPKKFGMKQEICLMISVVRKLGIDYSEEMLTKRYNQLFPDDILEKDIKHYLK
jgi:hypothetical protein